MIEELNEIEERLDAVERRLREMEFHNKETAVQIGRFIALYERIVFHGNSVTIGTLSAIFDDTARAIKRMIGIVKASTIQPELKDRVDAVVKYCDKTPERNFPAALLGAFFLGYKNEKEFLTTVPAPAKKSRIKFK